MPIYSYSCVFCNHEFDEFNKFENSGKSTCPKCGNKAFKIPAIFAPRIFKKREFADGTSTPDYIGSPKQEKAWMKAEGIVYDRPTAKKKRPDVKTNMERAFAEAHQKLLQGYHNDKPQKQRKVKGKVKSLEKA